MQTCIFLQKFEEERILYNMTKRTQKSVEPLNQYNCVPKQYHMLRFYGTISIEYIYISIGVHLFWLLVVRRGGPRGRFNLACGNAG